MATERELEIVRAFLAHTPGYIGCGANDLALIGACKDTNQPVTLRNVCDAFKRIERQLAKELGIPDNLNMAQISMLADAAVKRAEEQERNTIVAGIVGGLETTIDGRGRTVCMDADSRHLVVYKSEVERIEALGLDELRRIRDSRAEKERLQQMTRGEVARVVRNNASPVPSRYQPIPTLYVPPGKEQGVPFTFLLMKRLPSMELKRLLSRYGDEQISAACRAAQGRS
jgi:hypothetical protein